MPRGLGVYICDFRMTLGFESGGSLASGFGRWSVCWKATDPSASRVSHRSSFGWKRQSDEIETELDTVVLWGQARRQSLRHARAARPRRGRGLRRAVSQHKPRAEPKALSLLSLSLPSKVCLGRGARTGSSRTTSGWTYATRSTCASRSPSRSSASTLTARTTCTAHPRPEGSGPPRSPSSAHTAGAVARKNPKEREFLQGSAASLSLSLLLLIIISRDDTIQNEKKFKKKDVRARSLAGLRRELPSYATAF